MGTASRPRADETPEGQTKHHIHKNRPAWGLVPNVVGVRRLGNSHRCRAAAPSAHCPENCSTQTHSLVILCSDTARRELCFHQIIVMASIIDSLHEAAASDTPVMTSRSPLTTPSRRSPMTSPASQTSSPLIGPYIGPLHVPISPEQSLGGWYSGSESAFGRRRCPPPDSSVSQQVDLGLCDAGTLASVT